MTVLPGVSRGFPQSVQANARTASVIRPRPLPCNPLLTDYVIIRCYMVPYTHGRIWGSTAQPMYLASGLSRSVYTVVFFMEFPLSVGHTLSIIIITIIVCQRC
jgi:hypothetical protein